MSEPVVAQKLLSVDVEEGKNYFWCACGKALNNLSVMDPTKIQKSFQ